MDLICNKDVFAKNFRLAASVAATKAIKDVFQNILLVAREDGTVTMTASDVDSMIFTKLTGAEVREPGKTMVPKGQLGEILATCKDETISITADGSRVSFYGSRFKNIPTQAPDGLPETVEFEPKAHYVVRSELLRKMVGGTSYAVESENTKYALGGVFMDGSEDGGLYFCSTDSRRLSIVAGDVETVGEVPEGNATGIIPLAAADTINRLAADTQTIKLALHDGRVYAQTDENVFWARQINGRFPKWRQITPGVEGRRDVAFEAGKLAQVLAEVKIATTAKQPGVFFNFTDHGLKLSAAAPERGEAELTVPISFSGSDLVVKLDPTFVLQFLKKLDPDAEVLVWLHGDDAVLFTAQEYRYVLMPMS